MKRVLVPLVVLGCLSICAQDDGRIGPGGQRGPQTLAQRRHRKLDFFPVLHRIDPLRY